MQCQPCEPDEAQQQRRSGVACGDCDASARRTCARCRVRIFQSGVGSSGGGVDGVAGAGAGAAADPEPDHATGALPELEREFSKLMSNGVYAEFDAHAQAVQTALEKRRERLQFASNTMEELVDDAMADAEDVDAGLGVWREGDAYQGDVNLRTLNALLERVDQRGFERCAASNQTPARRLVHPLDSLDRRSPHQLEFHAAFFEACSRIIFKDDWEVSKPQICRKYGWEEVKSEVMISTPRRFGKTYSIAIFCACLSLAFGLEIGAARNLPRTSCPQTTARCRDVCYALMRSRVFAGPARLTQALGADRGVHHPRGRRRQDC